MGSKEIIQLGKFTEKTKNGDEITYIIQTTPPELVDEVVNHMTKFFIPREPLSKNLILNDDASTKSLQALWREYILAGTTMVALQILDDGSKKVIGANVTPIITNSPSGEKKYDAENFKIFCEAMVDMAGRGKLFEKYNVDRYMAGYGLSVDADYHGYVVGQRLLESRRPLCKKLGVQVTGTVFTASSSQHIAAKIGFEVLAECEYSNYVLNGEKPLEHMPGKMQMMGMRI